jgi:GntR family transcriptional regulator/MocR family aminotransferase
LGAALSAARRTEVARWAAGSGGLVIEDDYDGEFRYDRQAIGALQALAPEHVVYAGTASKTLAPGVRLGWLVLPRSLIDDVVDAKVLADRQTGSIDQLTLAELITSRDYDRQVRRCRLMYRRRRDRLVAALHRQAPQVAITGIAAGQHALLALPDGWSEAELVTRAAERGLALEGLSAYAGPGAEHPPALVVGYGTPPAHAFTTALSRLAAVLASTAQDAPPSRRRLPG